MEVRLYVPAGQEKHCVKPPGSGVYVPTRHGAHPSSAVRPSAAPNVPAGQLRHSVRRMKGLYVPARHKTHEVLPEFGL